MIGYAHFAKESSPVHSVDFRAAEFPADAGGRRGGFNHPADSCLQTRPSGATRALWEVRIRSFGSDRIDHTRFDAVFMP